MNKTEIIKLFKELSPTDLNEILQSQLEISLKENEENKNKLTESENENKELKQENKTWQLVSNSDDLIDMSEVAKALNYKIGRNKLFEFLRDKEILRYNNQPYQKYVDNGYFKIIEQVIETEFRTIINLKTVCTQKGLDIIRRKLDESNN
jgi:anti-repressor protein